MGMNFPDTPALNQVHGSYTWDGEKWVFSPTGGVAVLVAVDPPVGAADNSLWWESDTGILYMYYNDGNSKQWVAVMASGSDPTRVSKAGDTMTGQLTLNYPSSNSVNVQLQNTEAGGHNWAIASSGGGPGPAGSLVFYDGTAGGPLLTVLGGSGNVRSFGTITAGANTPDGAYYFGSGVNKLLQYDSTVYRLYGGPFAVHDPSIYVGADSANGAISFGNTGTKYLNYDGAAFNFAGGYVNAPTPPVADKSTKLATTEFVKTWAAPFDALAYNGMQVNGSMGVSQERGTIASGVNGAYPCDGWYVSFAGTMAISSAMAIDNTTFPGMAAYSYVAISTAQPTLGANDYVMFQQKIEGYRVSRLAWGTTSARPLTIGFWTYHTAGTYSVTVRNNAGNRSCAVPYTSAGGVEYKTVTIPGCTDGVWSIDNTASMNIMFTMAAGATYIAPLANQWYNANYIAAPGQSNGAGAVNNAIRITGVVIIPGLEAPSAAQSPLIMRPYDQELLTCQRYFYISNPDAPRGGGVGAASWMASATSVMTGYLKFGNTMRVQPTVSIWNNGVQNQVRGTLSGAVLAVPVSAINAQRNSMISMSASTGVFTVGTWYDFDIQADARL